MHLPNRYLLNIYQYDDIPNQHPFNNIKKLYLMYLGIFLNFITVSSYLHIYNLQETWNFLVSKMYVPTFFDDSQRKN